MKNSLELTLDEQMVFTLSNAKRTLYENGLCLRLLSYRKHAERLIAENQDTKKKDLYDALDLLRDFVIRFEQKRNRKGSEFYVYNVISKALREEFAEESDDSTKKSSKSTRKAA